MNNPKTPVRPTLFISHSSEDKHLIANFRTLIQEVSVEQIEPWFSSDSSFTGGLQPGEQWYETIKQKMTASSAFVVLLTNNSLKSNWIFFESGFRIACGPNNDLMLVTYNIDSISAIPEPFSRLQRYRADKIDGLREFCGKFLKSYHIPLSPLLFDHHASKFFQAINEKTQSIRDVPDASSDNSETQKLLNHFDRRFFEVASILELRSEYVSFYITLEFDGRSFELEISVMQTIKDVLDDIFSSHLKDYVEIYSYLDDWILIHKKTKTRLVVREVAHCIIASAIFKAGAVWVIEKLVEPYKPSDTKMDTSKFKTLD
jgi:TIR domain